MTQLDAGRVDPQVRRLAIGMYVGEPCRICGELLTMEDMEDNAVWAGYATDGSGARSAHRLCWELRGNDPASWSH